MNFEEFLNIIFSSLNYFFEYFKNIFNILINNNFVKLTIYIILTFLIIEYFGDILAFIRNIFSVKKAEGKNKVSNNTDIE